MGAKREPGAFVRAILPTTPAEDYPDMRLLEAALRDKSRKAAERFREMALPVRHPSAFLAALAAPLVDQDGPDYRPEDWR